VRRKHVGQVSDVHRVDVPVEQPLTNVFDRCIPAMIALPRAGIVHTLDLIAGVLVVREF
jgi:hypothetical protein